MREVSFQKSGGLSSALRLGVAGLLAVLFAGCQSVGPLFKPNSSSNLANLHGQLIGQNDFFAIVVPAQGDTVRSLAKVFYGSEQYYWRITDYNKITQVKPGDEVLVPLTMQAPYGITDEGFRKVLILTYHRFGPKPNQTTVTSDQFQKQMAYLKKNDFRVVSLEDVLEFRKGRKDLPKRAVVITVDDGYKSFYELAYPILKFYDFPATVFVYTNYVGRGGMNWNQLRELQDSGLISVQSHSHTHANLVTVKSKLDDAAYAELLQTEVVKPSGLLEEKLSIDIHSFAYPYGDTNHQVIEQMRENGISLGLTVTSGSNTAFSHPYLLKRTMIFGSRNMKHFEKVLASIDGNRS